MLLRDYEWSSDKPNVKIVKGDWNDNLDQLKITMGYYLNF